MKLKKKELVPGEWYYHKTRKYVYIFQFTHIKGNEMHGKNWYDKFRDWDYSENGWNFYTEITELRLATDDELSKLGIKKETSYEIY